MDKKAIFGDQWEDNGIPAIRPPSALIADPGDGKTYLEWNRNLEEDLAGYGIDRDSGNGFERVSPQPCSKTEWVDSGLQNGATYRYRVTAIGKDGVESPTSNIVTVCPQKVRPPKIAEGPAVVYIKPQTDNVLSEPDPMMREYVLAVQRIAQEPLEPAALSRALTIEFENGHRMVYDTKRMRLRDWTSESGLHLVYPDVYGNAIDMTQLDNWGLPDPKEATKDYPASPEPITMDYSDLSQKYHYCRNMAEWEGYTVQDGRVTFQYTLPLRSGYTEWHIRLRVWETWYGVEKTIGGTVYKGLNRKIEVDVPSYYDKGYSLCLNEAFGVNGSCNGGLTYDLQWDEPFLDEVHWSSGEDQKAHNGRQFGKQKILETNSFQPSCFALQVHPFIFINFDQGTFLVSARRFYQCVNYLQSNYGKFSKDGIWPNFMIDCSVSGERYSVETFEYLFTEDTRLKPPQLYMDAALHFRRNLAKLYQLNPNLTCFSYGWATSMTNAVMPKDPAQLKEYGKQRAILSEKAGMDYAGSDGWFFQPFVAPEMMYDENHPINQGIRELVKEFNERGMEVGFWIRPELVLQASANILSTHFTTQYPPYRYYNLPDLLKILEKDGIPFIRNHPGWFKCGLDGELPNFHDYTTGYFTPMSLMTGWYDEVVLPVLKMMKSVGLSHIFQDGGFSSMTGVDYIDGKATAIMPYYWRYFQDAARLGLVIHGECPIGWGNNSLQTPVEIDAANPWAMIQANFRGNLEATWLSARFRHIAHSIYSAAYMRIESSEDHVKVARFCQNFVKEHGHPDRVYLENLHWDFIDPTGRSALRGWVWDNAVWEYNDGRKVRYPSFDEIMTNKSDAQRENISQPHPTSIMPGK